jgi:hypothetical protein
MDAATSTALVVAGDVMKFVPEVARDSIDAVDFSGFY